MRVRGRLGADCRLCDGSVVWALPTPDGGEMVSANDFWPAERPAEKMGRVDGYYTVGPMRDDDLADHRSERGPLLFKSFPLDPFDLAFAYTEPLGDCFPRCRHGHGVILGFDQRQENLFALRLRQTYLGHVRSPVVLLFRRYHRTCFGTGVRRT